MSEASFSSGFSDYLSGPIGQTFASSIQLILAAQCLIPERWPDDSSDSLEDLNYDYVIIGSGSAGSVLASRLSEDSCRRVLLVEAGGDPPFESRLVSGSTYVVNTKYDWQYKGVRDGRTCKSHNEGRCYWPRGKMLGGSSSINAMIYTRGHFKDYDDMEAAGNIGWNSNTVLKYYKKSEHLHDEGIEKDCYYGDYHNYNGLLGVTRFNATSDPLRGHLKEALADIGLGEVKDVGDLRNHGTLDILGTIEDRERESTARGFLVPARDRKNLQILKNTLATKIVFDRKTATGVVLKMSNGKELEVNARKEVIVSGGTFNSPQLLMLSGIGPKEHLEKLNIPVVADLAVGENLHDHMSLPIFMTIDKKLLDDSDEQSALDIVNFLLHKKGPYAENNLFDLMTYVHLNGESREHPPQVQFQHAHLSKKFSDIKMFFRGYFGLNEDILNSIKEINEEKEVLAVFNTLLNPKSRGHVQLASRDPEEHPNIHSNYFSEREDIDNLIKGAHLVQKLVNTDIMKKLGAKIRKIDIPECDVHIFQSDDYWECAIMNIGSAFFHPMGTAKMGPSSDPKSVVDPELKVHGIKNLRVVDASIFPSTISCNTNAPTIMVGERGADFIRETHFDNDVC